MEPPTYRPILRRHIDQIPQLVALPEEERCALKATSAVFPFRVNSYVIDELIDWSEVPRDPIYQLTFPQRGMLEAAQLGRLIAGTDFLSSPALRATRATTLSR